MPTNIVWLNPTFEYCTTAYTQTAVNGEICKISSKTKRYCLNRYLTSFVLSKQEIFGDVSSHNNRPVDCLVLLADYGFGPIETAHCASADDRNVHLCSEQLPVSTPDSDKDSNTHN